MSASASGYGRTSQPPAAILLSGGASTRFDGVPKALVPVGGLPAIARMALLAHESGFDPVAAVLGRHFAEILPVLDPAGVVPIEHREWTLGRTGSVQAGLRGLAAEVDVLLWPVDHPFVEAMTLRALRAVAQGDSMATWIMPTFEGRSGHPVLLKPPTFGPILELDAAAPLRSLIPRLGPQVRRIPVGDPGVVANADTPEAFGRELAAWRARREGTWIVG